MLCMPVSGPANEKFLLSKRKSFTLVDDIECYFAVIVEDFF